MPTSLSSVLCVLLAVSTLLLLRPFPGASGQETAEPKYAYVIYHSTDGCNQDAVAIKGFVSGDDFTAVGGYDDENGQCSSEALCLYDGGTSEQCRRDLERTVTASANYTVDPATGQILECDSSNPEVTGEPACSLKQMENCEQSSIYPSCHFNVVSVTQLLSDPTLTKTLNPTDALNEQLVAVYYEDDKCESTAGVQSVVAGGATTPLFTTSPDVPCTVAVACAVEPDGDTCQSTLQTGSVDVTVTATTNNNDNGTTFEVCGLTEEEGSCEQVEDPSVQCQRSPIHPSCYHRLVPGRTFYGSPEAFLSSPVTPGTNESSSTTAPSSSQYVYMIYFGSDTCSSSGSTVAVRGMVSGEQFHLPSDSKSNHTCAADAVCMLHEASPQCDLLTNEASVNATFTVVQTETDGGDGTGTGTTIRKCDNLEPKGFDCFDVDECTASYLYPNCHWTSVLQSDLAERPRALLENTRVDTHDGVADTFYLLYYADDQCRTFEGLLGNPSGPFNMSLTTNETSCADAMACLLSPDGDACQMINPDGASVRVSLQTTNDGMDVEGCDDENVCKQWFPENCLVSSIYPSCYHRIVSAKRLFSDPEEYIVPTTTISDDTTTNEASSANVVIAAQYARSMVIPYLISAHSFTIAMISLFIIY